MRLADLVRLAAAGLRRNRSRSVLTFVGVVVGVGALVALLAYGAGLQQNARSEFDALELYNTLRVTSTPSPLDALTGIAPQPAEGWVDTAAAVVPVDDSLLARIRRLPGVLAAYPEVAFPAEVEANGEEVVVTAEAIPMVFGTLPSYTPVAGRFFDAPTDSAVLIGPSMARRLGFDPPETAVGATVELTTITLNLAALRTAASALAFGMQALPIQKRRHPLRVAGLVGEEDRPVTGFVRVLLPLERAASMEKVTFFSTIDLLMQRGAPSGYPAARVQLADRDAYDGVRAAIEEAGVYASGFRDQFRQLERLFLIMDLALAIIGVIALLVATIGIANTMMMNVMERTREIGVMKAVGGDEGDLQRLFLVESGLLGIVGGAGGLAAGWAVTAALQAIVDLYLRRLGIPQFDVFHHEPAVLAGVLGVALAVSLLAGVAPARRAARVEPMEALRAG